LRSVNKQSTDRHRVSLCETGHEVLWKTVGQTETRYFMIAGLAATVAAVATRRPVAFWDFSGHDPFVDRVSSYKLEQLNASNPVIILEPTGGTLFARAAAFGWSSNETRAQCGGRCGNQLFAPRASVPRLTAIAGPDAVVTMVAWVQLGRAPNVMNGGAFVGGVWDESDAWRQYAMFLNGIAGCPAKNGLVAHISAEGGPSPGRKYCYSAACGATALEPGVWHCLAHVYDGKAVRALVNGTLDAPTSGDTRNPLAYPDPPQFPKGGIFKPPPGEGAGFALGANLIHPGGGTGAATLGNKFVGLMGGLAVYDTALAAAEVSSACAAALPKRPARESQSGTTVPAR
jgi:hypothetical protein